MEYRYIEIIEIFLICILFFPNCGALTWRHNNIATMKLDNNGNLWVLGNISVNASSDICISGGNCLSSVGYNSNITFGQIVGFTANSYNGNITNGSLIGYAAANAICNAEYPGSHFCLKSEVLKTIANGNYSFTGTAWFQNGPPGYTANADDCSGWTTSDSSFLGPFWDWDANNQAGKASLTNCAQQKPLMCCK